MASSHSGVKPLMPGGGALTSSAKVLARREVGQAAIGPVADDRGETRELVEAITQELAGGHDIVRSGGDGVRRDGEA